MNRTVKSKVLMHSLLITAFLLVPMIWIATPTNAQTDVPPLQSAGTTAVDGEATNVDGVEPQFKDYKGVQIGMSADEVREKLGTPELEDDNEALFLISDAEIVQVVYDKEDKVTIVSITYSGDHEAAPTARAVLGEDVAASADGSVYKLVRYESAGYWVAYSRSAGYAPVVSVTMKKM